MLAWSPGTKGVPVTAEQSFSQIQGQHRIREMAATGARQDRDASPAWPTVPTERRLVPLGDAGVDGAYGQSGRRDAARLVGDDG
jgi:hypothetical protein